MTTSRGSTTTTAMATGNGKQEFLYTHPDNIAITQQVRSEINTESEAFTALTESIKQRGILEPLLVTPADGSAYQLLCGERRFLAAKKVGLTSIPVRIVDAVTQQDEVLAYQLTENLQREDLNPIDQAQAILAFVQAKLPDKNYDVDRVLNELVSYDRRQDSMSEAVAVTVTAMMQIAGKSPKTLYNFVSLLKLPSEIRSAVYDGRLPVSQGYLFAANLDCPDLATILQAVIKKPVTNAVLHKLLTAWKKAKPASVKASPIKRQVGMLKSIKTAMEKHDAAYTKTDLETLLTELQAVVALVKQKVSGIAVAATPSE